MQKNLGVTAYADKPFYSLEPKPQIWEDSFREKSKSFKNGQKIDFSEGHNIFA